MFVDRQGGAISGAYRSAQYDGQEEVEDDHAELAAYLERLTMPQAYTINRLRMMLILEQRGLLSAVDAAVTQAGGMPLIYWKETTEFRSDHPLIARFGQAVGLTPEGIKAMFKEAAEMAV